ncbi:MAG TPA: helix-turn-helix transcriptional regulator [Thermoanaerobaculia bacterium]|nr:helix-turn-helix transcriptional regulator [Thermoanaerobaculia bacterium]
MRFLRSHADMTQADFAAASGTSQADISRYELGEQVPSEETLRRMAKAANLEWPVMVHLRRFIGTLLAAADCDLVVQGPDAGARLNRAILEAASLAVAPYLVDSAGTARRSPPPEDARREAKGIVGALNAFPVSQRRRLVELTLHATRSWALAEQTCEASLNAAANNAADALAWAELALSISERVSGAEGFRRRLSGYCLAHVANALRVANDFDGADRAFSRAWSLWQAGTDVFGLLAEWRVLSLQASLRREQHRFHEALEWLERAMATVGANQEAAVRLLLNREQVLEQSGDHAGALVVLEEAAPLLEGVQDRRLLLSHRFDTADNLFLLGRLTEAEALLPEVRDLATHQANKLDLIRVLWLEGRVAAGLRKKEEAMAALEEVQREFTVRKLPYDAALASLDLAVLWLEQGRATEVRVLAVGMAWIFEAQGIQREALAALSLFQEAALREAASVDLVRRVIAEVEAVRRSAPRSG